MMKRSVPTLRPDANTLLDAHRLLRCSALRWLLQERPAGVIHARVTQACDLRRAKFLCRLHPRLCCLLTRCSRRCTCRSGRALVRWPMSDARLRPRCRLDRNVSTPDASSAAATARQRARKCSHSPSGTCACASRTARCCRWRLLSCMKAERCCHAALICSGSIGAIALATLAVTAAPVASVRTVRLSTARQAWFTLARLLLRDGASPFCCSCLGRTDAALAACCASCLPGQPMSTQSLKSCRLASAA